MMLSAKKNSHTRLNQAAKKSSYHKTPSIDVGPAQPARRTKISKTGMSVKQKTRIPTSTQPHATPFTMSKAPVPPPTSSQCAANVVTQEQQQHPAIMAPPSVSQTEDIGVPKSSTKSSPHIITKTLSAWQIIWLALSHMITRITLHPRQYKGSWTTLLPRQMITSC